MTRGAKFSFDVQPFPLNKRQRALSTGPERLKYLGYTPLIALHQNTYLARHVVLSFGTRGLVQEDTFDLHQNVFGSHSIGNYNIAPQ